MFQHSLGNIHIQIGEKGRGLTGKNTVIPNDYKKIALQQVLAAAISFPKGLWQFQVAYILLMHVLNKEKKFPVKPFFYEKQIKSRLIGSSLKQVFESHHFISERLMTVRKAQSNLYNCFTHVN